MYYFISYCKNCGKPFDIGTNFNICPECRRKIVVKGGDKNETRK